MNNIKVEINADWKNCYNDRWHGEVTDETFSHPAKFSRGLIRRIYRHAIELGWIQSGDTVLDPFGGVGLGALEAGINGLNWVGCELEQKFVDMGAGVDCQGISKADWVRFYGRWDRAKNAGLRWCPECLAQVEIEREETETDQQASFFEAIPSVSLIRHSGKIPFTNPHRYRGNLELFRKWARSGTWAVLLQGDSRRLGKVLAETDLVLGSPPYATSSQDYATGWKTIDPKKSVHNRRGRQCEASYGDHPAQIANLPEGDPQATIGSPPFVGSVGSDDPEKRGGLFRDPKRNGDKNLTATYGDTEGQLGRMAEGVISSPPFEEQKRYSGTRLSQSMKNHPAFNKPGESTFTDYGQSQGQLGSESCETFWQAARTILEQCYQVLPPGGVSIWVVKDFVRNGQRVPFGMQWRQLCEAVGFEHLETHRAMLVNYRGEQLTIDGDTIELKTERMSFFRRLHRDNEMAKIYWETLGRDDKARYLCEAHRLSWKAYNFDTDATRPIPSRMRKNAKKVAWVAADKPNYDVETSIDYEEVVCMRKPRAQ